MSARNWVILNFLGLLWGASFLFYKVLVEVLPPVTLVLGRVVIASIALNIYLAMRGMALPRDITLWRRLAMLALLNSVLPFILVAWGETRIDSGLASILNATVPIFIVPVAHFMTHDEKFSAGKVAGMTFGFLGVVALVGPIGLPTAGQDLTGQLAILLAALIYAFGGVYGRRFQDTRPIQIANGQMMVSAVMLLPLSLVLDRPWTLAMPGADAWAALIAFALLSTALAYVLFYRLLATTAATYVSLVAFLMPVNALWLGAVFLDESLTARGLLGMALIALGLAAIDGRLFPWLRRKLRFTSTP
jgi:drug/metabolite transporter (DMT)-like permease